MFWLLSSFLNVTHISTKNKQTKTYTNLEGPSPSLSFPYNACFLLKNASTLTFSLWVWIFLISYTRCSSVSSVFPTNWKLNSKTDPDSRGNSFDKTVRGLVFFIKSRNFSFYDTSSQWWLISIFINSMEWAQNGWYYIISFQIIS